LIVQGLKKATLKPDVWEKKIQTIKETGECRQRSVLTARLTVKGRKKKRQTTGTKEGVEKERLGARKGATNDGNLANRLK